jgi:hypothetical protein
VAERLVGVVFLRKVYYIQMSIRHLHTDLVHSFEIRGFVFAVSVGVILVMLFVGARESAKIVERYTLAQYASVIDAQEDATLARAERARALREKRVRQTRTHTPWQKVTESAHTLTSLLSSSTESVMQNATTTESP